MKYLYIESSALSSGSLAELLGSVKHLEKISYNELQLPDEADGNEWYNEIFEAVILHYDTLQTILVEALETYGTWGLRCKIRESLRSRRLLKALSI